MVAPSEESIKAAMEWNMNVVGVSTSAFFNTEAVLLVLENLAKKKGCSPRNPLLVMGDGGQALFLWLNRHFRHISCRLVTVL